MVDFGFEADLGWLEGIIWWIVNSNLKYSSCKWTVSWTHNSSLPVEHIFANRPLKKPVMVTKSNILLNKIINQYTQTSQPIFLYEIAEKEHSSTLPNKTMLILYAQICYRRITHQLLDNTPDWWGLYNFTPPIHTIKGQNKIPYNGPTQKIYQQDHNLMNTKYSIRLLCKLLWSIEKQTKRRKYEVSESKRNCEAHKL